MSSIALQGNASGAGVFTIASPNSASSYTLTLPAATGTLVAGANANSVALPGSTSGTITLTAPAVAGTNTVTLAAQTGTLNAAGPAVSAYPSATATISSATYTKVILNTEDFDTANAFDSTTNYRFTPLVAGYYQVNLVASMNQVASSSTNSLVALYKNGTLYKTGGNANNTGQAANSSWSGIVSLNGSTDYIEMYVYTNSANVSLVAANTNFSACLIRGA